MIEIKEDDFELEFRPNDEDFNEIYQKFMIAIIDNDDKTAEQLKKQILKNQKIAKNYEYWRARIRKECNLVEGEEFTRLMGIHDESQLWLKNKGIIQNIKDRYKKAKKANQLPQGEVMTITKFNQTESIIEQILKEILGVIE